MSVSGARISLGPDRQSVEITGRLHANASRITFRNPSNSELNTKQSALERYLYGLVSRPIRITLSSRLFSFIILRTGISITPEPSNNNLHDLLLSILKASSSKV